MKGERLKLILSFGFFFLLVVGGILVLALDEGSPDDGLLILVLLGAGFVVGGLALLPPLAKREGSGGGPNAVQWVILAVAIGLWCATPVHMYFASGENIWAASGSGRERISVIGLAVISWGTAILMLVAGIKQARRAKAAQRKEND